jgi:hypothetical protein
VTDSQEVTYAVDFCASKRSQREITSRRSPADGNDSLVPRIARLMALAIRFDRLLRAEEFRDYAELARLGRVTRARMSAKALRGMKLSVGLARETGMFTDSNGCLQIDEQRIFSQPRFYQYPMDFVQSARKAVLGVQS